MAFLEENRHSDFWNVVELLYPRVMVLPNETSVVIWERFEREVLPQIAQGALHASLETKGYDEILSTLDKFFAYTHDKVVYILWNDVLQPVIKTDLDLVNNYLRCLTDIHDDLWLWSPVSGYVIAIRHSSNVGIYRLLKRINDPYPAFSFKKNVPFFLGLHRAHPFVRFLHSYELELLSRPECHRATAFLTSAFPFDGWGKVDWQKISRKRVVGQQHDHLIDALGHLTAYNLRQDVFIVWPDSSVPVVRTSLQAAFRRFDVLASVAYETYLFNPTSRYLVVVDLLGNITVGMVPPKAAG